LPLFRGRPEAMKATPATALPSRSSGRPRNLPQTGRMHYRSVSEGVDGRKVVPQSADSNPPCLQRPWPKPCLWTTELCIIMWQPGVERRVRPRGSTEATPDFVRLAAHHEGQAAGSAGAELASGELRASLSGGRRHGRRLIRGTTGRGATPSFVRWVHVAEI
jgi:hypothetical protein